LGFEKYVVWQAGRTTRIYGARLFIPRSGGLKIVPRARWSPVQETDTLTWWSSVQRTIKMVLRADDGPSPVQLPM
jgi:hypothetical protein